MNKLNQLADLCEKELIIDRRQRYKRLYIIERRSVRTYIPRHDTYGPFTTFSLAQHIIKKGYLNNKATKYAYRISILPSNRFPDKHILNLNKLNKI